MSKIKSIARKVIPPVIIEYLKSKNASYGFFGRYSKWADAEKISTGYDSEEIFKKVRASALKVKNGEAAFERDSIAFKEIKYSWPVLSALMIVSARNKGKFSVLDFGGSLGSMYYQNKKIAAQTGLEKWVVVEQGKFVEIGKKEFEDNTLKFAYNLKEAKKLSKPDILILGGVLQYLKSPYSFLDEFIASNIKFILVDRTTFVSNDEFIAIQKVSSEIYPAEYPAWFFNEQKFLKKMLQKYKLVYSFDCEDSINIDAKFKGFLFERR